VIITQKTPAKEGVDQEALLKFVLVALFHSRTWLHSWS
jgi:hypothetical protein